MRNLLYPKSYLNNQLLWLYDWQKYMSNFESPFVMWMDELNMEYLNSEEVKLRTTTQVLIKPRRVVKKVILATL